MKTIKWFDRNFEILLMVCALLVIVFVMGAQVVARKFLGASIEWSEELGRYLFVWMGFLSISYTPVSYTHLWDLPTTQGRLS